MLLRKQHKICGIQHFFFTWLIPAYQQQKGFFLLLLFFFKFITPKGQKLSIATYEEFSGRHLYLLKQKY